MSNILGTIMNAAGNAASSNAQAASNAQSATQRTENPIAKENRDAFRKEVQKRIDAGDYNGATMLLKSAPQGVDAEMYNTQLGNPSVKSQVNNALGTQFLQLLNGKPSPAQNTPQPANVTPTPNVPNVNMPNAYSPPNVAPMPNPAQPQSRVLSPALMDDLASRAAIKEYLGFDIGAHYLEGPQWFEYHRQLTQSGMGPKEATMKAAQQFGFIPDGASNLDLPEAERKAIFNREFGSMINDPVFDATVRKLAPQGVNVDKFKAGFALDYLANNGRYIPENYQSLLDRYRGLEDPKFLQPEMQTWIYERFGIDPRNATPEIVARARKDMDNHTLLMSLQQAYQSTTGKTRAEFDLEASKPLSAQDRAKHGIGTGIKTYAELADAGKRFETDGERKLYNEWVATYNLLKNMEGELFGTQNGKPIKNHQGAIFKGIGNAITARTAGKGGLLKDQAFGNKRGINYEFYTDTLASAARRLIAAAGETGGRYTDRDIVQVMQGAPDAGHGLLSVPDSDDLAQKKYQRFLFDIERKIQEMEVTTTINPTGQPNKPAQSTNADEAAQQLIDKVLKQKGGK